ncbi:MAG TPA: hypothetical protein VNA15_01705 [Candidatus Angelobacter sp.]|nr:hypothetical protein [Candidatus Angelobacter sp.]
MPTLSASTQSTNKVTATGRGENISRQRQLPLEFVDRVYTPLVKEVTTWRDDPTRAFVSEWKRLNIEERYWVKRIPSKITKGFEEAEILIEAISQLRLAVQTFISTTLNQLFGDPWLTKAGFPEEEGLGNVDFRVLIDENPIAVFTYHGYGNQGNLSKSTSKL